MRPEVFFAGTTRSTGVLENASGSPTRRLRVAGRGTATADGGLRLEQDVTFDDDPPTTRTWILRRVDAHRYVATLTDASGDVEGAAYGNVFHVRYATRVPFGGTMEQWLYLQPDGRTVVNVATVTWLGFVAARISETIVRDDR